jgi:fluoride exporter
MARRMQSTFLVMAGGAMGAAARYHSGIAVAGLAGDRWPWATLTVNVLGALLIGMLAGWAMARDLAEPWRLFLGVGLLGGFTTFSAFSLETWRMIEHGAWVHAASYAAASVTITILCVGLGVAITRAVLA